MSGAVVLESRCPGGGGDCPGGECPDIVYVCMCRPCVRTVTFQ